MYAPEDPGLEEPAVCFVPLFSRPGQTRAAGDLLEQSMLLLGDGLASGAALTHYETLLRRLPDLPAAAAKLPNNLNKNRYRDIAPCESTN